MRLVIVAIVVACVFVRSAWATDLDTIGLTRVRALDTNLVGASVTIAQPEALISDTGFEVSPYAVGQPISLFTWISTNGSSTNYPNSQGTESSHADGVGNNIFGTSGVGGVATGVAHVDNYEADYFYAYVIAPEVGITDQVVNQSFAFGGTVSDQEELDSDYDNYADDYSNIFCSAAGLGSNVGPPGTAYNSMGINPYGVGNLLALGPTLDNGRSKPDLCAPGVEESFAIPYVSGVSALLVQAAADGIAGTNISAARDLRTIKAIILNGALKPGDWTHTPTAPLDTRYGAGVLDLYYSYEQFAAHQQKFLRTTSEVSGGAHPPLTGAGQIASLLGWDFETISNPGGDDVVNHYCFNVSSNSTAAFTLTATLAWDRAADTTGINNLDLYLYNATNGALIASSVSTVDNVQHLYVPHLAPGQYDLQVLKLFMVSENYTPSETYAVAYQFFPITAPPLSVAMQGTNTSVCWPSSPTVFILQETPSLTPPIDWTAVGYPGWITNDVVDTPITNSSTAMFYRLIR